MVSIGFGLVGTGYMGKAHAVALQAVGPVFGTRLRPVCEMLCATTREGAEAKARAFGFRRSTDDWRALVADDAVEAVIIASPQQTHRRIALAALAAGKPVFCEKPLGASVDDARAMAAAAASGPATMVGFNYVRTPATQLAREMILAGEIGDIVNVAAEHTEDFLADPDEPASWRTRELWSGALGDLATHIINGVLRLAGPIMEVVADVATVHGTRKGETGPEDVTNDDHANLLCHFASGARGTISASRVSSGRKMGYAYRIVGTRGAIAFDQEDQNSIWLYRRTGNPAREGFTRILIGPEHPDYRAFSLGAGHGTGYGDQIVIEARDFLRAIDTGEAVFPTFADGLAASLVVEAAFRSAAERRWVKLTEV